jgi:hypothetical protein
MPDGKIVQTLKEFVATANKGNYKDEKELMSYFPELKSYDTNLLKEFVATSNKGNYKDENELFSYFPEFESKKKEKLPFQSSATPSFSEEINKKIEFKTSNQPSDLGEMDTWWGVSSTKDKFARLEKNLQRKASADNYVKLGIQVLPGMKEEEINQAIKSNELAKQDADYYEKQSQKELQSIIPDIQTGISLLAGRLNNNGVPDYKKILAVSKDMSSKLGGGDYVREVINQQLINQEQSAIIKPQIDKVLNAKIKKEKGIELEQFLKGEKEKVENLYTKKQVAIKQQLNQAQALAQTEYKAKENEVLEKYKPLISAAEQSGSQQDFDAVVSQYYTEMQGIQRKINARLKRTSDELTNQFNSEIAKLDIPQSTKDYLNKAYQESYKEVVSKNLEKKKKIQDIETTQLGFSGLLGKSFLSGLLNSIANRGAGLVGVGLGGSFADYLRSFRTTGEKLETVDLEFKGNNWFNPQTYITRLGKQIGFQAPTIALTMMLRNPVIGGMTGFVDEQLQNGGDVYNQVLSETNNPVKAKQAAARYLINNIPTLPLYYLEADMLLKYTGLKKGNVVANILGEVPIEIAQELPQSYLQQAESKDAKPLGRFMKEDAPNIALETAITTLMQSGGFAGAGKLLSTLKQEELGKNYIYNLLNSKGQNAAFSILEMQHMNGQITEQQLAIGKEKLLKVQDTIQQLKSIGLNNTQVEGYLALFAEREGVREKLTKTSDPELISAYQTEIEKINKELEKAALGKVKATTVEFTSGGKITILNESDSVLSNLKNEIGQNVSVTSTDESTNKKAQELANKVPQEENDELANRMIDIQINLHENGIQTVEQDGVLMLVDEQGNIIDENALPEEIKNQALELKETFEKLNGNVVLESFETEEVARQYAPVTDKMYEIEKEFAAQGFKIDTDYDNEIAVYDSEGNLVEPQQLPEGLKNLASQYEMATSMLGELSEVAREKALTTSRGATEEAVVVQPKQITQETPKAETKEDAEEIKRIEEEKKLIEQTSSALKERGIQQSKEGKAIYALVPKKFYDKTKKPIVQIAEAYAEAKRNKNANPDLVKAVEDFLNPESNRLPLDQKGRRVGNLKYKKGENHLIGRKITLRTPTGEKIKGTYKLVPAAELVPSHNPVSFSKNAAFPLNAEGNTINDRDYEKGTEDRTAVSAFAQTLDSRAIEQTPWVSKEGIVYNGNNRTMSRQLAAKNETDKEYLEQLKEKAEMYGFTEEQVDSMQNPTLVFEVDENLPFTTKVWKMFNAEEKKAEKPGAVAIRISKTISDKAKRELSNLYEEAETASDVTSDPKLFKKAIDILVQDGVIQAIEIPKYSDKGVATPEGVALLERVILGASLNESAIETLMSLSMGNIKNAILKNVVGLMQNATKGENSLIPDITGAISIIKKAKSLNSSVVDFLVSFDIFGENQWTIGEMSLAILLDLNSPNKLKTFLSSYNQDVGQQLMFGESTKQGILNNLLNNIIPDYEKARKIIERAANRGTDEAAKGAEKPNLQAAGTTPKNTISKERFSKLIERIKKAFPKVNIISSAKEFADKLKQYGIDAANLQGAAEQKSKVNFMRTPSGTIYGAQFPDGTVYINNEVLNAETPIHELSHIWESMFPNEWKKGIELMRNSKGFQKALKEIQNNSFYANKTLAEQESEALNTIIGRKGEGYFQNEMLLKFKAWLRNLFIKIGEALNIKISPDTKLNQFTDKVIGDILGGKEVKGEITGKGVKLMNINGENVKVKEVNVDVVNGFYSPLEQIISETKFDKLPAKQWAEKFAKGEEAKWTGLADWLSQQQGSVSKADIQKYLKENRISVVEVVKGEALDKKQLDPRKNSEGNWDIYYKGDKIFVLDDYQAKNREEAIEVVLDADIDWKGGTTKFSQYQLEGEKENYKEVLVTMPSRNVFDKNKVEIKKNYQSATQGTFDVYYNGELLAKGYDLFSAGTGEYGQKTDEQLKLFAKNLYEKGDKYNKIENKQGNFKSSHFDEPNILVHLRMNTRKDSQGNKVLFLEEIQSDWGQKGKKEGFIDNEKLPSKSFIDYRQELFEKYKTEKYNDLVKVATQNEVSNLERLFAKENGQENLLKTVPIAPFVTDTNAWTKLGLKVALKEAVKQGATKIAWTTGEQQVGRYEDDFRKQVDKIETYKRISADVPSVHVIASKGNNQVFDHIIPINGKTIVSGKEVDLEDVVGKEIANKIRNSEEKQQSFEGDALTIGGKGMEDFYGKPSDAIRSKNFTIKKEGELFAVKDEKGKTIRTFKQENEANKFKENYGLGIVGNVAKSLFKQEPKTTTLQGEKPITIDNTTVERGTKSYVLKNENGDSLATMSFETGDKYSKKDLHDELVYLAKIYAKKEVQETTQYSIDITPELRAQVEKGQPLFMASSENTQAIDDFDKLNKNSINEVNDYIKKYGAKKIKQIRDITSNFGTYITNLEKSNYIIDKKC